MKEKLKQVWDDILVWLHLISSVLVTAIFGLAVIYFSLFFFGICIGIATESYLWFRMFYEGS